MRKSLSITALVLACCCLQGCIYKDILTGLVPEKKVEVVVKLYDDKVVESLQDVSKVDCITIAKMMNGAAEFVKNADLPNTGKVINLFKDVKTLYHFKDETAKKTNDLLEVELAKVIYEDGKMRPLSSSRDEMVKIFVKYGKSAEYAAEHK